MESGLIQHTKRRRLGGVVQIRVRAHWVWNTTRARHTRPSSHARRQGLGSPRAIGIHMRRPRLRKCSLSFLLSLYLSRTPFPSIHVRQFAISVANLDEIDPFKIPFITQYVYLYNIMYREDECPLCSKLASESYLKELSPFR